MANFFPLLLTGWDDVSSRWGPLLNLSFFFPHRPYLWFIYLLFAVYFDFLVGYFISSQFFFCACDGMIYRVAGVKVRPQFLSFYFLDSLRNGRKKDAAIDACRHSWIEMKTDGRNALEALRNENDGRMCQNVNGLNSIPFAKQCGTIKNL